MIGTYLQGVRPSSLHKRARQRSGAQRNGTCFVGSLA
ncbi:hypothetical protein Deipe_1873 [Deinococcus peraridilitoris DSM 19664]|uniref:Uncharacterized protein n=1 Tax=Deinococcus peraridilitoris (strain DSM 19664 / LMG 22246 / CIP 109416 / KR-200) TaxID=937777 RepID=L0A1Q9_DEIPD|nr:hypothetical protein Deipe_1873 [Deinococcus peraridilitoris DSM 19664]